ncbi:MAG: urease accessory protein UreF [Myxococcales bacterium]|nr:urease accessory protein UreF [Myxococcales bacterium]
MLDPLALLRLLQLSSPSLPIGAYAYSQGLETAVEAGWVSDEPTLSTWLREQLRSSIERVDLPVLVRLYRAVSSNDRRLVTHWCWSLLAMRETRELVGEECDRGRALARLLRDLGVDDSSEWAQRKDTPFVAMFAKAAVHWRVPLEAALYAYTWSWLENQTLAGIKLVPLGQVAGQRILLELSTSIPECCIRSQACSDQDIGGTLPALAIASSRHETQYTRLFRS